MDVTAQDQNNNVNNVNDIWSNPNFVGSQNANMQNNGYNNNNNVSDNQVQTPTSGSGGSNLPTGERSNKGELGGFGEAGVLSREGYGEQEEGFGGEQNQEAGKLYEPSLEAYRENLETEPKPQDEKLKPLEALAPEVQKPKPHEEKLPVKQYPKPIPKEEESLKGVVVDKRTGKERTHRVDVEKADPLTLKADLKEQNFIEGVEKEHVNSIV